MAPVRPGIGGRNECSIARAYGLLNVRHGSLQGCARLKLVGYNLHGRAKHGFCLNRRVVHF